MKTEAKLRIENLASELFIEDLGKVRGGQSEMTTMALGEEDSGIPLGCGPADGPCHGHGPFPYPLWIEEIMKFLPGTGGSTPGHPVTTLATGEE